MKKIQYYYLFRTKDKHFKQKEARKSLISINKKDFTPSLLSKTKKYFSFARKWLEDYIEVNILT